MVNCHSCIILNGGGNIGDERGGPLGLLWVEMTRISSIDFPALTSLIMSYICVFFKAWSPKAPFTVSWMSLKLLPARARPATKSRTPVMHCGGVGWWQLTVYRPAWLASADSAERARFSLIMQDTWRHTFYYITFILRCNGSSRNILSGLNLTAPRICARATAESQTKVRKRFKF